MSFFSLHLHNFSFLKATMKIEQGGHSKTLTRCCSEVGQQFSSPWDLLTVSVLSSLPACPTVLNTWAVSATKSPMPEYSGHNPWGLQTDTWHNHKGKDLEYFPQKNFLLKSLAGFPTSLPGREWNTSSGFPSSTWRGWESSSSCAFGKNLKLWELPPIFLAASSLSPVHRDFKAPQPQGLTWP